jgi:hypothetical protein
LESCAVVRESPLLVRLCQGSKSLMLITVLLAESAQIGNTNAILPMTTAVSAGAYLLSTTPRSKAKTGHLLYWEVAGCATGSARLLGAHVRGGLLSLYGFRIVPFPK